MSVYMTAVVTAYNERLLEEQKLALILENGDIGTRKITFPFKLPVLIGEQETYDINGFPIPCSEAQQQRDIVLRCFVNEPLTQEQLIDIYKALEAVQKNYPSQPEICKCVLENIFLRSCLTGNEEFLGKVVEFLYKPGIVHHVDWQKMVALTGRQDLLQGFQVDFAVSKEYWVLSAGCGNAIAMKIVADNLLSLGIVAEAKHYLTMMTTMLVAIPCGLFSDAEIAALQAGVRTLGDRYFQEKHFQAAKKCYQQLFNSGVQEVEALIATIPDQPPMVVMPEPSAPPWEAIEVPCLVAERPDRIEAIRQQYLKDYYPFNSGKGNAVRLLLETCPISFNQFVSAQTNQDVLCFVARDEWLTQEILDSHVAIEQRGYLYGRIDIGHWKRQPGRGKDPLGRGECNLKRSFEPVNLQFLNALMTLEKLKTADFSDFVSALPDALFDQRQLFLLASLHPRLLRIKYKEDLLVLLNQNPTDEQIKVVNENFIKRNIFNPYLPSAPPLAASPDGLFAAQATSQEPGVLQHRGRGLGF